jgi:hypothetical protein
MSTTTENSISYFDQRMNQLGITQELNQVNLWRSETIKKDDGGQQIENVLKPVPVFSLHPQGIKILVYSLRRSTIRIQKEGSNQKEDWSIIRLEKPLIKPNGDVMKYRMPKGQGSYPFFPPALLHKYDLKTQIDTLYITEGFFKAFKGSMHGVDIVGLPSITHMKNRETGALHPEILELMKQCKVRRMVWLTDGDCLDITSKEIDEKTDLYKRPSSFYASISTFKQLLDDYDIDKYFVHIDIDNIVSNTLFSKGSGTRLTRDQVKGLDDLLCSFPDRISEILQDLSSVSKPGEWFSKFNITNSIGKVWEHFRLGNPTQFYQFHQERRKDLKGKEFVFRGTRYKFNEEKGECDVLVPGAAKDYFRVGDQYYKFVSIPNKYKQLERSFKGRLKGTIIDDHGKEFCKHIPKYEAFCNVPDHVNFHQVINSCFNVYNPLDHSPDEEECTEQDCALVINFLKHIFGENIIHFYHPKTKQKLEYRTYQLALDYFQLMYQQPWQKLPIVCLVSQENNTGKSTVGKLLKQIFGSNCAIVGNQDLAGDFNAHWATKLCVICDETKIDKQHVVEKVKSLSTADKIMMNAKGKDHVEIDCFIKFMFITNNEKNFITLTDEDIRYWVIKVPTLKEENPNMLDLMIEEIPAFLSYLNRRKLATENLNRMWFHPSLLRTEALRKVVEFSKPQIVKEITSRVRELFFATGHPEIMMTKGAIQEDLLGKSKAEDFYLDTILKDHMKLPMFGHFYCNNQKHPTPELAAATAKRELNAQSELEVLHHVRFKTVVTRFSYPKFERTVDVNTRKVERKIVLINEVGRPFIFRRSDFLSAEEIENNIPDPEMMNLENYPGNGNGNDDGKAKLYLNGSKQDSQDELPF